MNIAELTSASWEADLRSVYFEVLGLFLKGKKWLGKSINMWFKFLLCGRNSSVWGFLLSFYTITTVTTPFPWLGIVIYCSNSLDVAPWRCRLLNHGDGMGCTLSLCAGNSAPSSSEGISENKYKPEEHTGLGSLLLQIWSFSMKVYQIYIMGTGIKMQTIVSNSEPIKIHFDCSSWHI